MLRHYISDKWLEYLKMLRNDLPIQTITEARGGFYAGVIAALSILEKTRGAALDDMGDECREYIQILQAELNQILQAELGGLKRTN